MKKWTKILCCLSLGILMLAGCCGGGLKNISNTEKEVIYNGNYATVVGDYLFYGNSFASSITSESEYKSNSKIAYLSRLNTSQVLDAKSKDYSPKNVENVAGGVTTHEKSFNFVLGKYIYYVTPYTEKAKENGTVSNYYNYSTIYRCKLNGQDKSKIFNSNGEISQIEVLKADGKYYLVMLVDTRIVKIDLSKNKVTEIANDVTSVAMPKTYQKDKVGSTLDFNGYIYYTTSNADEDHPGIASASNVMRVALSGGEAENVSPYLTGTITFVGREKDVLFYTKSDGLYICDLTNKSEETDIMSFGKLIYTPDSSSETITKFSGVYAQGGSIGSTSLLGYTFMGGSTLMFTSGNACKAVNFVDESDATISSYSLMLVSGATAYISTSTNIYKAELASVLTSSKITCKTIVSMTGVHSGDAYAFDGKYIYFYAALQTPEKDDDDETEIPTDSYEYFYRARIDAENNYQLLSLTDVEGRRTK